MIRNNLIATTIAAGAMVAGMTLAAPASADADGTVDCSPCAKAPGSSGSSGSSSSSSTAAEETGEGSDDGGTIQSPGGIVEKWQEFPEEQTKKWTEFPEKQAKKWTDFPKDQAAKWGLAPSDDEGDEEEE